MKVNKASLKRKAFREQMKGADIIIAPGAYDAYSARIIEKAGFKTIYIGGSNIHAVMGHADGESTLSEYMQHVKEITEAVNVPVLADLDTGFGTGSAIDMMRAVREVERIGVAACHTEDQVTTGRVFAYNDPECVSRKEMLKKIEAALEAREDDEMAFIARTDARARYGLEEALERGRLFAKAGCDMVCVQALQSVDELKRAIDYVGAPSDDFQRGDEARRHWEYADFHERPRTAETRHEACHLRQRRDAVGRQGDRRSHGGNQAHGHR